MICLFSKSQVPIYASNSKLMKEISFEEYDELDGSKTPNLFSKIAEAKLPAVKDQQKQTGKLWKPHVGIGSCRWAVSSTISHDVCHLNYWKLGNWDVLMAYRLTDCWFLWWFLGFTRSTSAKSWSAWMRRWSFSHITRASWMRFLKSSASTCLRLDRLQLCCLSEMFWMVCFCWLPVCWVDKGAIH